MDFESCRRWINQFLARTPLPFGYKGHLLSGNWKGWSHKDLLDARRLRVETGEASIRDWDVVKNLIGKT